VPKILVLSERRVRGVTLSGRNSICPLRDYCPSGRRRAGRLVRIRPPSPFGYVERTGGEGSFPCVARRTVARGCLYRRRERPREQVAGRAGSRSPVTEPGGNCGVHTSGGARPCTKVAPAGGKTLPNRVTAIFDIFARHLKSPFSFSSLPCAAPCEREATRTCGHPVSAFKSNYCNYCKLVQIGSCTNNSLK
jgi:hypothetical protein